MQINLQDLREIKLKFEQVEQLSQHGMGMSIDVFTQYLNQILGDRMIELNFTSEYIQWAEFLEMLDQQSKLQEQGTDYRMFENPTKTFVEYSHKSIKPLRRSTDRIFSIENLHYMRFNQHFMVLVFDDNTVSILQLSNHTIVAEFTIPYEIIIPLDYGARKYTSINEQPKRIQQLLEPKQLLDEMRRKMDYMSREVNVNPRTLKPRSLDPKLQIMRQRTHSEYKPEPIIKQHRITRNNLYVTGMATHYNVIFVGLINKDLKIYHLDYESKKMIYSIREGLTIKLPDIPKEVHVVHHKIKEQDLCLVLLSSNVLKIHAFNDGRRFTFEQISQQLIPLDDVSTMYAGALLILSSSQGEFCVLMDHFIKVPGSRVQQSDGVYHLVLKRKVIHQESKQSVASFDYSVKHQMIVFGSMIGALNFFELRSNEFVGHLKSSTAQIMKVCIYDNQNQVIVLHSDFVVNVYDLQRQTLVQTFKTLSSKQWGFRNEIRQSVFLQHKGILFISGNTLQSWVAREDPQLKLKYSTIEQQGFKSQHQTDSEGSPLKFIRPTPSPQFSVQKSQELTEDGHIRLIKL